MKQRVVTTQEQLDDTVKRLSMLGDKLPLIVTVTEGTKIRSGNQNSRYWCNINFFMSQLDEVVERIADKTGYTNYETRKILAEKMPVEHGVVLFMRKAEAVHECLKMICNIPTSTRLGTRSFMKFEDILEVTMAEVLGSVNKLANDHLSNDKRKTL